ncbi:MAG TPA: signal recognition particle-docking protein FtsY [Candidatus Aphodomonas merdavium]|nr:signal recognition particle-docking protein FtsY [Candidatus Aphodomonas merdavium]
MAGFFARLKQGLSRTRQNVSGKVDELVSASPVVDDEFYEDLTDILILADVGVNAATQIVDAIKERAKREKVRDAVQVREMLRQELKERMDGGRPPLQWPMVMLVVGVNGVGKTTTIGKLALRFKNAQHGVLLAAADTFRAAAADQLQIWAERAGVPIVRHGEGADPAAVVFDAIRAAKARGAELLIIDTAGRLHNKKNLMDELEKITRIIKREYAEANLRSMLVVDATAGQNCLQQARMFKEVADINGVVLTKMDGTAKGGIAIAIQQELKLPVWYIGVGEGIDDLQAFDASDFVDAIL